MTLDIFLGVDGCPAGWLSVEFSEKKFRNIKIFPSINVLWSKYSNATLVLIDIPIGLLDDGSVPRKCDADARKYITRARSSSVFRFPVAERGLQRSRTVY